MSSVKQEIPDTEIGLNQYIDYARKAIKENLLHNRRLEKRIEWCNDALEAKGLKANA